MSKLDEIEARAAAATPGPWMEDGAPRGRRHVLDDDGNHIARLTPIIEGSNLEWDEASLRDEDVTQDIADAAFIDSAPTDIAYLLRVARAAERAFKSWDDGNDVLDKEMSAIGAALAGRGL